MLNVGAGADVKMKSIKNLTVVEQVIQQLTRMIQIGRFRLGERLPSEHELVEELQISRNSLREAMKMLSAMGIVEIRQGNGTYVCSSIKPTIFDSTIYSIIMESSSEEEIIELRQVLDESVLMLAIAKCSDEEIDVLDRMNQQMRQYFQQGKISEAGKLDYQFHMKLTEFARNSFISRIVTGIYSLFEGSIEKNIRTEEQFARADMHHQEIVNCLRSRNRGMAHEIIERSLSSWRKNVREKL